MMPPPITSRLIRFGTFQVDPKSRELYGQGRRIKLQEQPFLILSMLLEHPGEVVTREEMRRVLWPRDTFVDFDQGLNKAINKIRRALGDSAEHPHYIETLKKCGYRLLLAVDSANRNVRSSRGGDAKPQAAPASQTEGATQTSGAGWRVKAASAIRAALALVGWQLQSSSRIGE